MKKNVFFFSSEKRSAEGRAEIVLDEVVVAHRLEWAGIHGAIAEKLVDRAVIVARPRAGDDVDLAAAGTAHVSGIAAGDDLELHHRVRGGAQVLCIECGVCIGSAIEQEEVGIRTCAADDDCGTLSGAPIEGIGFSGLCAEAHVGSRNSENEIDQHAAIEGQLLDGLRFDDLAYRSICGVQNFGG